jgi:MFS family permease
VSALQALQVKEYRQLLLGRFLFIMGLRMLGTLVGWWIYELTQDPFAIGLIGLSEVIPAISLALYAGHVIDIKDKRTLLIIGVVSYFICCCALWWLSSDTSLMQLGNKLTSWCIYGVIFLTGIIRAFTGPTFHAILASVVPRHLLQSATTLNQGTWLTASVAGHALGGLLIAAVGIHGTITCILLMVAFGFIFLAQLTAKPPMPKNKDLNAWDSVKEGLQFVFRTKEVLGALSLDLFAVLLGGAVAMVPVFAKDILLAGPTGFGWLNAASDLGAGASVVLLTIFPMRQQQGKKLFFAVAGFGVCIIVFALSKVFWLSFVALLVSGLMDGISVVVRGTILQLKTPDDKRGRVMSVNSMFINSSNELGQFESGVMARWLGVVPSVVFGGCATLAVVIFTWFKAPALRQMEY